jgi:hypothetical protein
MSTVRMAIAKAADDPWKFFHIDNDMKVKLGVGTTVGSCMVAMLMMT